MKLVCVMHPTYNDVVLFEIINSKDKVCCSVHYHNNEPILINEWLSPGYETRSWKLCNDKASLLQLRRMKQLFSSILNRCTELQPDDMASKVMELIGKALVARMDEIYTNEA
jgi:hypothetical protein